MTSSIADPTAVAAYSGLGLALAAVVLSAIGRRRRARASAETSRRLDALAGRVAALEARIADTAHPPATTPPRTPVPVVRIDRAEATSVAGPTLIRVPNLAANSADPTATDLAASGLGRRYAAIWEMAEAGTPAEAIARDTGHPVGQVELILGLKRQGGSNGGPRSK